MNEFESACMQIISSVGDARSYYIEAIHLACEGKYDDAEQSIENGNKSMLEGHQAHAELLSRDAKGELKNSGMLLIHAEDQLMSAEDFKILAREFIETYKLIKK